MTQKKNKLGSVTSGVSVLLWEYSQHTSFLSPTLQGPESRGKKVLGGTRVKKKKKY
jgi:hypothetical protein